MKKITVLTQSYHQPELLEILVKSFEKHKIETVEVFYVIVEGSSDISYKDKIKNLSKNIRWYNNEESDSKNPIKNASIANGQNIEFGKQFIETEWAFVCHSDVAVLSKKFFETFENLSSQYELISTSKDLLRINAGHISGLFVKTEILKKINCMPDLPRLDVGDRLTEYCVNENKKFTSLPNSYNDTTVLNTITGIWKELGDNCGVDRCVVDNEVIFAHLGRGTPKSLNSYYKEGKVTYNGWLQINKLELNK